MKEQFFYRLCSFNGDAYLCLDETNSFEKCQTELNKAKTFQANNREAFARFVSPNTVKEMMFLARKFPNKRPRNEKEAIKVMKESFWDTIQLFTQHEWPECRKIAGL